MITHTEKMRVNWVDTDASGLIHYTAALRYFEIVEHALMRKLLGTNLPRARGFGLPRVHVECEYRAPLHFPDEFQCTASVLGVGRSSVTYGYEARKNGVLCLEGKIVAVATDADGRSMPIPDEFRAAFERAL
jgi:acyl-CoA thioester hydrolase